MTYRKLTKMEIDKIREMKENDFTVKEIADIMGVDNTAVEYWLYDKVKETRVKDAWKALEKKKKRKGGWRDARQGNMTLAKYYILKLSKEDILEVFTRIFMNYEMTKEDIEWLSGRLKSLVNQEIEDLLLGRKLKSY